jgi:hypothetical protein
MVSYKKWDMNFDNLMDLFFRNSQNTITVKELVKIHNTNFETRVGTDFSYSN